MLDDKSVHALNGQVGKDGDELMEGYIVGWWVADGGMDTEASCWSSRRAAFCREFQ